MRPESLADASLGNLANAVVKSSAIDGELHRFASVAGQPASYVGCVE
jgi:dihydroxyacid dehydratase/phosphogluconate dehydratase